MLPVGFSLIDTDVFSQLEVLVNVSPHPPILSPWLIYASRRVSLDLSCKGNSFAITLRISRRDLTSSPAI